MVEAIRQYFNHCSFYKIFIILKINNGIKSMNWSKVGQVSDKQTATFLLFFWGLIVTLPNKLDLTFVQIFILCKDCSFPMNQSLDWCLRCWGNFLFAAIFIRNFGFLKGFFTQANFPFLQLFFFGWARLDLDASIN